MERVEYERQVVEGLQKLLLGPDGQAKQLASEGTGVRVVVEEVRLDTSSAVGSAAVVLYRDLERPKCLFGWRMEAMAPTSGGDPYRPDPEIWTTVLWANFGEHVIGTPYGLPGDCSSEGITWTG